MADIVFTTARLKVQLLEDGKLHLLDIVKETDEQRRIAALETQVNQLSVQVSLLQSAITVPADHDAKLNAILDSAAALSRV